MAITGDKPKSIKTLGLAVDIPVIVTADGTGVGTLASLSHWVNDTAKSGKKLGASVFTVKADGTGLQLNVAQGSLPADKWAVVKFLAATDITPA